MGMRMAPKYVKRCWGSLQRAVKTTAPGRQIFAHTRLAMLPGLVSRAARPWRFYIEKFTPPCLLRFSLLPLVLIGLI